MKQTVKIAILLIAAIVVAGQAFAQHNRNRQNMDREELAKVQANHIAKELAFDEATTAKFVDAYCKCQNEIWALGPHNSATDSCRQEKTIERHFERSQKILDIRKKYYAEYGKFLSDSQIERVYQIEKKMMQHLGQHHNPQASNKGGKKRTRH